MTEDRIEKSWEDIDFSKVKFDGENPLWSYGRGGYPLSDGEYSIQEIILDKDYPETRWTTIRYKLPDAISFMLKEAHRYGREDKSNEINRALRSK